MSDFLKTFASFPESLATLEVIEVVKHAMINDCLRSISWVVRAKRTKIAKIFPPKQNFVNSATDF